MSRNVTHTRSNAPTGSRDEGALGGIDTHLGQWVVPATVSKQAAWLAIEKKIVSGAHQSLPEARSLRLLWYAAAAAVVVLVAGAGIYIMMISPTRVICSRGVHLAVVLPDSSGVQLNSLSTISYNAWQWKSNRQVHLDGEAFFRVKKGSTFTVVTSHGTVRVLGTSFNVSTRDGVLNVACVTGRVAVRAQNEVVLGPGQGCQTSKGGTVLAAYSSHVGRQAAWVDGQFWYTNVALTDVFAEIERQYNITIRYQANGQRFYTGFFTNKNLDEAMRLVCRPMQLRFTCSRDSIYVY